jgi:hypothetical protein
MVVAGGGRGRPRFILTAAGRGPPVFPGFQDNGPGSSQSCDPRLLPGHTGSERTNELVLDIT